MLKLKTIVEVNQRIAELHGEIERATDEQLVVELVNEYVRLLMVRYACRLQADLSQKIDLDKAYELADKHMEKIKISKVSHG